MKVLVAVHGAGKQPSTYFKEALGALAALLGAEPPCVSVWYADIGNVGGPVSARARGRGRGRSSHGTVHEPHLNTEEVATFKAAFSMLVQSDLNSLPQYERHTAVFGMPAQFLAEIIATDLNQVASYLFSSQVAGAIQKRMLDGLNQALGLGDELVIVSHSLGTVVAFDCLRAANGGHNVSAFFTLGSPLSKLRRLSLRTADLGAIPGSVGEWLNLYDTTDPVANALGPVFPSRQFRLRDVFIDVDDDPIHSHDYFANPETLAEIASALL